jgi:hypothetical protein
VEEEGTSPVRAAWIGRMGWLGSVGGIEASATPRRSLTLFEMLRFDAELLVEDVFIPLAAALDSETVSPEEGM